MSLSRKILSNTLWQVLGRLITAMIGVFSIKIITNYLPTDIYGQYTTIFEYIGFFAIAADFGLYTIGVREMAKQEDKTHYILGNLLSIRILLILLCLGTALIVTPFIPKYNNTLVEKGLWIVILGTSLNLINGMLTSVLQFKMQMLYANISLVLGKLSGFIYILLVVFFLAPTGSTSEIEHAFTLLLWSSVITNIVLLSITFFFTQKITPIKLQVDKDYILKIIKNSLPYGLAIILSAMYFKIDVILLSQLTNYHQTGIYGVPLKIMEILSVIPVFFMNASLPSLTENFHKNKQKYKTLSQQCLTFLLLVSIPLTIGGILLSKPITYSISSPQFLTGYHCLNNIQQVYDTPTEAYANCSQTKYSEKFSWKETLDSNQPYIYLQGADQALQLILIALLFNFINTFITFSLITIDKQNLLLKINALGVIFNVVANLILIPKYGFLAAALTTILSEILILFIGYHILHKFTKFHLHLKTLLKIISSSFIMGTTIYFIQPFLFNQLSYNHILITIPIGGIIFTISALYMEIIPTSQIKSYLKLKS